MTPMVFLLQGLYYAGTGLWALIDVQSFQAVTGPKTDVWLVKTVGMLAWVIGCTLIAAGARRRLSIETLILSLGCVLGFTAIDIYYVSTNVISKVYLLDALAECAFGILALSQRKAAPVA